MAGSMFPTTTTVKADGSLKQLLKYSHALIGFTFFKSLILIGCIMELVNLNLNLNKAIIGRKHWELISVQLIKVYLKEVGVPIIYFP